MENLKNVMMVIALVLVAGGAGFWGGIKYQESQRPSMGQFRGSGLRQGGPSQRPAGSGAIRGEIIGKDETGITIKLPDDSSKIVLISESTVINKATEGSVDDLETGGQVMIFGQTNPDGSLSATQIQLAQ